MGQCAHLKNYATIPDCKVVAISEPRPKLAALVAARYGVPKIYSTYQEMIASEKLDAVIASQPFERHGVMLPEILARGVHVFSEKPIGSSVEAGERVVAAERKGRGRLMVGYHKRSDPATMFVKTEIDRLKKTGELGKLKYVRILMPAGDWVQGGFNDLISTGEPQPNAEVTPRPKNMSKKVYDEYIGFVNYYIHQVNLMRHLLGEPYRVKYAEPTKVLFVGQSVSGIPCTIEMTPYWTTVDWAESAFVAFERGYIKLDLPAPLALNRPGRVEIFRDPGDGVTPTTTVPQLPWVHAMRQQAINFCEFVRGKRPPMTSALEALEDLKVARDYIFWKEKR